MSRNTSHLIRCDVYIRIRCYFCLLVILIVFTTKSFLWQTNLRGSGDGLWSTRQQTSDTLFYTTYKVQI